MKLLLLLAACVCGLAQSSDAPPPIVSVQVVDPSWLPIPNMSVAITRVEVCEHGKGRPLGKPIVAQTDQRGCASFTLEKGSYVVAAGDEGGAAAKRVCLSIYERSTKYPTAYVQLQLSPAKSVTVR